MRMKGSQIVMECLLEQGVDTVFGYPGGTILNIYDEFELHGYHQKIHHYLTSHEQGASHAADGYARSTGKVGVCFATSGPGATNLVTGIATAYYDSSPVVFITCNVSENLIGKDSFQEVDITGIAMPITKATYLVRDAQTIPDVMRQAFAVAATGRPGPVVIDFLKNVTFPSVEIDYEFVPWTENRKCVSLRSLSPSHDLKAPEPNIGDINTLVDMIAQSEKPMLICGGGVRYSEAHEEFRKFAETTGIPFAETQAGKSAIVWDHPLNLGGVGVTGCSAANEIAREADVVIGVGTRYTDFTTASKWLFREDAKFVNINVSEFQALKLDALPVVADAKRALPALLTAVGGYKAPYTNEVSEARGRWQKELDRLDAIAFGEGYVPEINDANAESAFRFARDLNARLTQTEVLGCINHCIDPEDVVIGAAGSLPGDMQRMWRPRAVDTYNMEYGYSCMGYEISGALGVKYAIGDKDVYAMCGDGSFIMLHAELLTAVQERKKINVCLFNNASYGCINNLQVGHGNDTLCTELRWRGEDGKFSGAFMPVDFARIAEGYGCKAYTIHSLSELKDAIADAKKIDGVPVLFDIRVLPKSMTDGYGAWWRVGDTAVSENQRNLDAYQDHLAHVKDARKY